METLVIASFRNASNVARRPGTASETAYYRRHEPRSRHGIAPIAFGVAVAAALGGVVGLLPLLL